MAAKRKQIQLTTKVAKIFHKGHKEFNYITFLCALCVLIHRSIS